MAYAAFALLLIAGAYGFVHEGLSSLKLWSAYGVSRFWYFAAAYWAAAAAILSVNRRWIAPVAGVFALGWTVWWSGWAAPLAVVFFLASSFCLGRLLARAADGLSQVMLGTAVWMTLFWTLLHFPVNTAPMYFSLLALPIGAMLAIDPRALVPPRWLPRRTGLGESLIEAALLFLLMIHWWMALKPEVSSDGLSMHLALPATVATRGQWPFDFAHSAWAVMPASVDALYAALFALGGEAGAKLLNLAYLVLLAVLIYSGARRWRPGSQGASGSAGPKLAVILFLSTPLALLVTGSLYIENVWSALIVSAVLSLLGYLESEDSKNLGVVAAVTGAAIGAKLIAAVFALPILVFGAVWALRRRQFRSLAWASVVVIAMGAPPYAYAWAKTGNPIFPFANAIFKSPFYYTQESFDDTRFHQALVWRTPYDVTFRSEEYIEGEGGSSGFQYFLLLAPAALLIRRRAQMILLVCGAVPVVIILAALPNLRYLYPALPLFSIVIAGMLEGPGWAAGTVRVLAAGLAALNTWFLPSADGYDRDFAIFRKQDLGAYIERAAPARILIDRLNRNVPGEAVAFFSTDGVAGLKAPAYNDGWHSEHFWKSVRDSPDALSIRNYLLEMGIHHVVAPLSRTAQFRMVADFLTRWLDADGPSAGALGLFRLRESPLPRIVRVLDSGQYEDSDSNIEYSRGWITGQFSKATHGSVTYSDVVGDVLKVEFRGTSVTYTYTRALNRGVAEVRIDGTVLAEIDAYSAGTEWQASRTFDGFTEGQHTLEIRVTGEKNPHSSGGFVDLDRIEVR